ncbi:MAG: SUMF1/EgtB/PvdO family nonheme iron enzyme [bacterium]
MGVRGPRRPPRSAARDRQRLPRRGRRRRRRARGHRLVRRQRGDVPRPVSTAAERATHPLRLHDVLGNVAEWTFDWFGPFPEGLAVDPVQLERPARQGQHVRRGGGFRTGAEHMHLTDRNRYFQLGDTQAHEGVGLRLVRTLPPP